MTLRVDNASMYAERRRRLMEQIVDGVAWITSPGPGFNHERDKNLEYLTGLRSPTACLILAPKGVLVEGIAHPGHYWFTDAGSEYGRGRRVQEALFVEQPSSPWGDTVVQRQLPAIERIRGLTGVEAVYGLLVFIHSCK